MGNLLQSTNIDLLRQAAVLLEKENARLALQNKLLLERIAELSGKASPADQEELACVKELLAQYAQDKYGPSSERRVPADAATNGQEAAKVRKGHGPTEQPKLPLVDNEIPLPDDQQTCPQCQGSLEPMGEQAEESEEITVERCRVVLVRHRRLKYRCRCNGCVVTAPAPERLLAGGRYSIAFTVQVAVDKYLDHAPLTRQVRKFARLGLEVTSQTLWDQLSALVLHLRPTYEAILATILLAPVIHADETHWYLLAGKASAERKRWYAWGISTPELAGYAILDSRSMDAGRQVLAGYRGTVVADGYRVYESLSRDGLQMRCVEEAQPPPLFRVANCWSHARRKFVDAEQKYPECTTVIDLMRALFAVEREGPPGDLRTLARLRETQSAPLVDAIYAWAKEQRALPRSGLGKALSYLLAHEAGLRLFLTDPAVPMHNNAAERAMRGLVVGRKNHLGSKSRQGIEAAAICYTLFESAKLAGVDPAAYVEAVTRLAIRQPGTALLPAAFAAQFQGS